MSPNIYTEFETTRSLFTKGLCLANHHLLAVSCRCKHVFSCLESHLWWGCTCQIREDWTWTWNERNSLSQSQTHSCVRAWLYSFEKAGCQVPHDRSKVIFLFPRVMNNYLWRANKGHESVEASLGRQRASSQSVDQVKSERESWQEMR